MSDKELKTSRSSKRDEKASSPSLEAAVAERGQTGGRGRRASAYVTRDLTKGSVQRTIWFLAWPQMVEAALAWASRLVDAVLAGSLGFKTIAGVGVAQSYTEMAEMSRRGLDTGMAAMIARAFGAGNRSLANHIALQAFSISALFSLLMLVVGIFLTEPLLRLVGVRGEVLSQGAIYMRVILIGTASVSFTRMSEAALGASGDVMTPMRATVVARIVHIALAPFLVFGWWWFPSLGIMGAALANVIAQCLAVVINFSALFAGTSRLHLTLRGYRFDLPLCWRLVRIGTPASVTGSLRATAMLVLNAIVVGFGDVALAAYTMARRVEGVIHVASDGLGSASGTLVSQNLGARQPERARQTALWSSAYVMLIMIAVAGSVLAFPGVYASIFTRDQELIAQSVTWLRISAFAFVALGIGQVLNETFNRAGDTGGVMILNLLRYWAVEVPLAFALSHAAGLGQYGVIWATVIAVWLRLAIFVPYFLWGRWLRIKVI